MKSATVVAERQIIDFLLSSSPLPREEIMIPLIYPVLIYKLVQIMDTSVHATKGQFVTYQLTGISSFGKRERIFGYIFDFAYRKLRLWKDYKFI